MISFSVLNIPVRVQPWFWITLAIVGGALRTDTREEILFLLLFMIAGFLSILIHELGHALTARHFGNHVQIVLQAFGGYAAYSGAPMNRNRTLLVTAAGPAIQILLGLAAYAAFVALPDANQNARHFLFVLALISLVWAVLNLFPVLPLDGGRLVESALGPERIRVTLWISAITATLMALLAFIRFGQPFVAVFMGMFAFQSFQALRQFHGK